MIFPETPQGMTLQLRREACASFARQFGNSHKGGEEPSVSTFLPKNTKAALGRLVMKHDSHG